MGVIFKSSGALLALAVLAGPAAGSLAAQQQDPNDGDVMATFVGTLPLPDQMTKGPKVEGIISARSDGRMKIVTADGNSTSIAIADYTKIKSSGGFLGLNRDKLAANSLLNGLPVSVETLQWSGGLVASQVELKKK